jgi:DNA-directed RNA polymerase specialized sigma24 family protein
VVDLPEELRLVITAHYWGEIPIAEIARVENLTPSAVRKRLGRAKKILRKKYALDHRRDDGETP